MPIWLSSPNLYLAYDPADFDEDNDILIDSGPNGFDAPAVAAGPVLVPAGTIGLNGKPTIYFPGGANQFFEAAAGVGDFTGQSRITIFAIAEADYDIASGSSHGIIARDASGDRGWNLHIATPTRRPSFFVSTNSTTIVGQEGDKFWAPLMPMLIEGHYDGALGDQLISINGVLDNSGSPSPPATIGADGPNMRVGGHGFGSSQWKGHLGQIIIFVDATDQEIADTQAELLAFYNLYSVTQTAELGTIVDHQGIATDGTIEYTFDTGAIRRRDGALTQLTINSSPFSGLTNAPNHVGDGAYHNGLLYTPLVNFPDIGATSYIGVYDADTLARVAEQDTDAQGAFAAVGYAIDTDNNYIAGLVAGVTELGIDRWDLTTLTYVDRILVDSPVTSTEVQGLTYRNGVYWVSFGNDADTSGLVALLDPVALTLRPIFRRYTPTAAGEGIDWTQAEMRVMYWNGSSSVIRKYTLAVSDGSGDAVLRVQAITDVGATLSIENNTTFLETQIQVSAAADTSFASPILDATDASASRFVNVWTGGAQLTNYIVRARVRTAAGWQPYTPTIPFTTLATGSTPATASPPSFIVTSPAFGEPVTGTTVPLVWSDTVPGRTVTLIEIATALGPRSGWTWATLTTSGLTSGSTFDADAIGAGFYSLRFTLSDGSQVEHPGFRIGSTTHWFPAVGNTVGPPNSQGALWDTSAQWLASGGTYGAIGGHDLAALVPPSLSPDAIADEVIVTGTVSLATDGAGNQGSRMHAFEHSKGGIGALLGGTKAGGDQVGIAAYVSTGQSSQALSYFQCSQVGLSLDSAFEVVIVAEPDGVTQEESEPVPLVVASWRALVGIAPLCARRDVLYYVLLHVTKPDRIGTPNRLAILARVFGPAGFMAEINETIDLEDNANNPVVLDCGYAGFVSQHTPNSLAGDVGFREFWSLAIDQITADECDEVPFEIPDDVTPEAVVVCDVVFLTLPLFFDTSSIVAALWEIADAYDTGFAAPITPLLVITDTITAYTAQLLPGDYIARVTLTYADSSTLVSESVAFVIPDNEPPSAPVIVTPLDGETISGGTTVLRFNPSIVPDGDPIEYGARISIDGGDTYLPLFALGTILPDTDYDVDLTGIGGARNVIIQVFASDGCLETPYEICIIIVTPPCPEEIINITTVRRLELWTDIMGNAGERELFIPEFTPEIPDHREVGGEETMAFTVPRVSARNEHNGVAEALLVRKVLRVVYEDLTWEEVRIARISTQHRDDEGQVISLQCESIAYDLNTRIIRRTERSGDTLLNFGMYGKTLPEQVTHLLSYAPGYFITGTILDTTTRGDVDFEWDNCGAGRRKLSDEYGLESSVRRVCNGLYALNYVHSIGAGNIAPVAVLAWEQDFSIGDYVVVFDASGSSDADGVILIYTLDPGDGSGVVVIGTSPYVHDYGMAGDFDAILTVTDNSGLTDSVTVPVTVDEPAAPPEDEVAYLPGDAYGSIYGD